jgi:hypothetical protein
MLVLVIRTDSMNMLGTSHVALTVLVLLIHKRQVRLEGVAG